MINRSWSALDVAILIFYIFLLAIALGLIINMYACTGQNCGIFRCARKKGPSGSKPYIQTLLIELGADGIWPFAYIAGTIIVPMSLKSLGIPITMHNFGLMFLV